MTGMIGEFGDLLDEKPLPFDEWEKVNPKEEFELWAGQHRVAALGEHGRREQLPAEQLWWTCEIYDQGKSVLKTAWEHVH